MKLFSVPICHLQTLMKTAFFKVFSWNYQKQSKMRCLLQRTLTFSLSMYMGLVYWILHHVFSLWCQYVLKHEVYTIMYKNGHYNQCEEESNYLSQDKKTNLRNYFSDIPSHYKSQFLILASVMFLLFHLFESLSNCNNGVASLSKFLYGPESQECNTQEGIELEEFDPEEVRQMLRQDILVQRSPDRKKQNVLVTIFRGSMSFLGLSYLILLYLSPMGFHILKIDSSRRGRYTKKIIPKTHFYTMPSLQIKLDRHVSNHYYSFADSWPCQTTKGAQCQFPYTLKGQSYNYCTNFSHHEEFFTLDKNLLRCALNNETDEDSGMPTSYGPCSNTCPGGKLN